MTPRLKNFLVGWLLLLGLKEGLVECATVCIKSVVILPTESTPKESTEATKPTEPTLPTEPTDIVDEFFDDLPFDSIEDEITGHPCQVV